MSIFEQLLNLPEHEFKKQSDVAMRIAQNFFKDLENWGENLAEPCLKQTNNFLDQIVEILPYEISLSKRKLKELTIAAVRADYDINEIDKVKNKWMEITNDITTIISTIRRVANTMKWGNRFDVIHAFVLELKYLLQSMFDHNRLLTSLAINLFQQLHTEKESAGLENLKIDPKLDTTIQPQQDLTLQEVKRHLSNKTGLELIIDIKDELFIHETYDYAISMYMRRHILPRLVDGEEYFLYSLGFSDDFLQQCGVSLNFCVNETREETIRVLIRRVCYQIELPGYMLNGTDKSGFPIEFNLESENDIFQHGHRNLMKYSQPGRFDVSLVRTKLHTMLGLTKSEGRTWKFYYHGTSWEHARNICAGIVVQEVRPRTDFGTSCFCVSHNLRFATKWAIERHSEEGAAVVIFGHNPDHVVPVEEGNRLVFNIPDESWQTFTFNCRRGIMRPNQMQDLYMIKGPIVANPDAAAAQHFNSVFYSGRTQEQTAIRTNELALHFDNLLVLVVVFRRHISVTELEV